MADADYRRQTGTRPARAPRALPRLGSRGAWLCGVAALTLYLLLLNRSETGDGTDYADAVRLGQNLFHPHHVLYDGFCFVLHRAVALVHYFDPLRFMTALSSLITAATVMLLCDLLTALTGRPRLAAGGALAYAFTYATFYLGTTAEVYPHSILVALLALWLVVRGTELREPTILLVALFSALAMLFHQTGLFFTTSMAYLILRRRGSMAAFRYCLYAGLACGVPYIAAGYHMGARAPHQLWHWLFFYVHTPQFAAQEWGSGLQLSRVPDLLWGIICTITTPDYVKLLAMRPLRISWLDVLGAVATLALVAALAYVAYVRRRHAPRRLDSALRQMLWLWLIQQAVFTAWWDQTNVEFWYMLLPPLYILCTMSLSGVAESGRPAHIALWTIPVSLGVANLCGHIYPQSRLENNPLHQLVAVLGCDRIQDGDVFVAPLYDLQPYINYACRRTVAVATLAEARVGPDGDKQAALAAYARRVFTSHHQVFMLEAELDQTLQQVFRSSNWTIDEIRGFYRPYLVGAPTLGEVQYMGHAWKLLQLHGN